MNDFLMRCPECSPHGAGSYETDGWQDPRQSIEVRLIMIEQIFGTE